MHINVIRPSALVYKYVSIGTIWCVNHVGQLFIYDSVINNYCYLLQKLFGCNFISHSTHKIYVQGSCFFLVITWRAVNPYCLGILCGHQSDHMNQSHDCLGVNEANMGKYGELIYRTHSLLTMLHKQNNALHIAYRIYNITGLRICMTDASLLYVTNR